MLYSEITLLGRIRNNHELRIFPYLLTETLRVHSEACGGQRRRHCLLERVSAKAVLCLETSGTRNAADGLNDRVGERVKH